MHVRASSVFGIPVVDDSTQETVGVLGQPFIHPDSGKILGFFVFTPMGEEFFQTQDIVRWGMQVHLKSSDTVGPIQECIRMHQLLSSHRPLIGQRVLTQPGKKHIGTVFDVQFDTRHFLVEWIFPRRFFIARTPIPTSEILEVTEDAIWIKEPLRFIRDSVDAPQEKDITVPLEILTPQADRTAL